jgi:glycosyltransferase involved in cell wall biosynthesis
VVPLNEPARFAQALAKLAEDRALRAKMGEFNRRKVVAEHGWRDSAQKLFALYESLLANRRAMC